MKEAEEKDIKKLMIDDEEEDRKLLESIPDESKSCLMELSRIYTKIPSGRFLVIFASLKLDKVGPGLPSF